MGFTRVRCFQRDGEAVDSGSGEGGEGESCSRNKIRISQQDKKIYKKLVYPYDMNASNVPERVLDGIDMGGVEAGRTSGALEVPGIQHPGKN